MASVKVCADRCFDPYRAVGDKGHRGKDLRSLSTAMIAHYSNVPINSKICADCRLRFYAENRNDVTDGCTPEEYMTENSSLLNSIQEDVGSESALETNKSHDTTRLQELEELLNGLKDKYSSLPDEDPMRLAILTAAPLAWSVRKVASEFGTTRYMAQRARILRNTMGVLAMPPKKCGRKLSDKTVQVVLDFFNSDVNGRIMPGRKDTVSVKVDEQRTKVQKRLLLGDLKELHKQYKLQSPEYPISFSAFAKLRPKHCVLAGGAGTHSVCVCTIHENCKMMLEAANIEAITKSSDKPLANYKDCLQMMMCESSTPSCHLRNCKECPNTGILSNKLRNHFVEANIENISCSTWTMTDRSNLDTLSYSAKEFIEELCNKLTLLQPHSFIAKQQSLYIEETKQNLKVGEALIMYDFSENYAYVIQNASQAFHYNNAQCTVMPAIVYFRDGKELKHKSFVFLSDCLSHDTVSVHVVQGLLITEIRKFLDLQRIIYWSDGAKQHFKNRFQISNLMRHEEDFGIPADWHFHATAHGKNSYDGIGAIFKREAMRASLQAPSTRPITNATDLYKWAKNHFSNIAIMFYSQQMHKTSETRLKKRFAAARPVPNISKQHGFITLSNKDLFAKIYSKDINGVTIPYH